MHFFSQYLKEAGWAEGGRVIACTQPRRLAVQVTIITMFRIHCSTTYVQLSHIDDLHFQHIRSKNFYMQLIVPKEIMFCLLFAGSVILLKSIFWLKYVASCF